MESAVAQKTLLIIEDDIEILDILELIFQQEGYRVFVSENGSETNDLTVMAPDLILMDIRLTARGKEGAEICLKLKSSSLTHDIPIILLSAEMDIQTICSACGADDYVSKPFDVDYLSGKIKQLIAA